MDILSIPKISISLAPPEEHPVEPYSPFAKAAPGIHQEEDAFRPVHLTPPPMHSKFFKTRSSGSPGSPSDSDSGKAAGAGLDRARFEALLKASKATPAVKKEASLRREVALKAHQNRQAERRALFLSKLHALPSPTAALMPATPPDSPAIFHYTLPSPGLISPIAHYESLQEEDSNGGIQCEPWVEQVDFKLLAKPTARETPRPLGPRSNKRGLPSLEQISARLNNDRSARIFDGTVETPTIQPMSTHKEQVVVGRLKMPVRSNAKGPLITVTDTSHTPPSPLLIATSDLEVRTLVVPRTKSVSPTELTRMNLLALNCREKRSSAMLNTLRRRTESNGMYGLPQPLIDTEEAKKSARRHSAPPETSPLGRRKGFEHPILTLPGAF